MTNKLAQHTKLDKIKKEIDLPDSRRHYDAAKQETLPFYGKEPDYSDWDKRQEWHRLQRELGLQTEPTPKAPKFSEPNLHFPDLTQEHIRTRRHSPAEIADMLIEKSKHHQIDFEKQEHPTGYSQYGHRPRDYHPSQEYEISEIDKQLQKGELFDPEVAKKRAFELYQKLRKTSIVFYAAYKEANEMAGETVEIDYDKSYTQLVKEFPEILVKIIRQHIGELFGITGPGSKAWGQNIYNQGPGSTAKGLLRNLQAGFNIFNLTPDNFTETMNRMRDTIEGMEKILKIYLRRKQILKKLPQEVSGAAKEFLSKKENREFLKFMDEHFPGERENFVDKGMGHLYVENRDESVRERGRREYLSLDDLTSVRTFKEIFSRSKHSASFGFPQEMIELTKRDINERLEEEIKQRFNKKIAFLALLTQDINPENLNEFIRYCYKEYRLDLGSIIKFALMIIDKTEHIIEGTDNSKNNAEQKAKFIEWFCTGLKDKFSNILKNSSAFYTGEHRRAIFETIRSIPIKEYGKLTEKDLDNTINTEINKIIISQLPNFETYNPTAFSYDFRPISQIIEKTGKFSIEAFTNYIHSKIPVFPKEFILNLVRSIFKGATQEKDANKILGSFSLLNNMYDSGSSVIFLELLKKSGKFNPDSFTKYFISSFQKFRKELTTISQGLLSYKTPKLINTVMLHSIRSMDTMDRDLSNLSKFVSFIHNEAGKLTGPDILRIIDSKNFINFEKFGIIRKMLQCYSEIKNQGGLAGIHKKYGKAVNDLAKRKYISPNFYDNIRYIQQTFKANEYISPMSENFNKLFETCSAIETDLEILEMSETFKELMKDYEKKDENLFKLDFQISPKLRFRVLKDMDPRILRVGVETSCCQRIGGAADSAAKDSFVNPLAGVVILEWESGGQWNLLTQSYFHYVSEDNAYILDNVESNDQNVKKSGVDLEAIYAYLGAYLKAQYDVKYFLSGKGYSKISDSKFETGVARDPDGIIKDPRSFSPKAGGKYTDFRPGSAIDLLAPKFDLEEQLTKAIGEHQKFERPPEVEKKAFERALRKIILGAQ